MSNFTKTISVLLLCLTFVGQSIASSVMVYSMVSMNMNENMTMMDHSNMPMNKMSMKNTTDATQTSSVNDNNCCAQKCQCFASGCSTAFAFVFSKIVSIPLLMEIPTKIISTSQFMPTQALTSLYRPPIVS